MSEHFEPDRILVTVCEGCGREGGGWDEVHNEGWAAVEPWLDDDGKTRTDRERLLHGDAAIVPQSKSPYRAEAHSR